MKRSKSLDCGGKVQEEIEAANAKAELESGRVEDEDLLPHCDLSVWLRDCSKEILQPLPGKINGEFPKWLNGSLLRNGPGSLTVGDSKFQHLFDGSALLHRFGIKDGEVTYQNRFLQSNAYKKNHSAQRIVVTEFGTARVPDPCQTIFQKLASYFSPAELSDNCMISIYPFSDELYAFSEVPTIHRIDPETLATINPVDVSRYVNIVHHTSHPHVSCDGTVFNLGLSVTPKGPSYSIVKFPNTAKGIKATDVFKEAEIMCSVNARWTLHPGYMHTFGLTPKYYVIVEQPLSVSIPGAISLKFSNRPSSSNLRWFPEYNTLIHVVCRETGQLLQTFWADPFFYLHIINQYEEDSYIVLDICIYKDPSMIDCMYIDALKEAKMNADYAKMFRGRPMRFVLPLGATDLVEGNLVKLPGSSAKAWLDNGNVCVSPEILCDLGCETPRINYPEFLGKKYNYFYAISSDVDAYNPGTVIKVNTTCKTRITWYEKDAFPSEPVFVPHPNAKAEDDGVVLVVLLWSKPEDQVALVVLDAKNLEEVSRAVFQVGGPVPKCLHGWFNPS